LGTRRFWRWAEADGAFGVSGKINNNAQPAYNNTSWPAAGMTGKITLNVGTPPGVNIAGNNAQANDEIFSFHGAGANVVFGDGSVHFLSDGIDLRVLRSLVTRSGKESISEEDF
jgi:prepilin-type processing-associated H-X9-DG protein